MHLYIHQVTLYTSECVKLFYVVLIIVFSLSQRFSNGLVRHIYLQGYTDMPT